MIKALFTKCKDQSKGTCYLCSSSDNIYLSSCGHFLCTPCQSASNICCPQNIPMKFYSISITKSFYNFFQIPCYLCKINPSQLIDMINCLSFCSKCSIETQDTIWISSYYNLEQLFSKLFHEHRKKIPPEIRLNLLLKKSQSMDCLLKACRELIEIGGVRCLENFREKARFVDLRNFQTFSHCKNENCSSLDDESVVMVLQDVLKNIVKNMPSEFLNKSLLRIKSVDDINVLVILGRKVIEKEKGYIRCCVCLEKLNFGSRAPIELDCKHTLCFNCHMVEHVLTCPIDLSDIFSSCAYIPSNYSLPLCHKIHPISLETLIYKLPCGHISCQNCTKFNTCFSCFCPFNPFAFKPDKNLIKILSFCQLICELHNTKANFFNIETCEIFCFNCEKKPDTPFELHRIMSILNSRFLEEIKKEKAKTVVNLNNILKQCEYYNVLSCQDKYKLVKTLIAINSSDTYNSFTVIEEIRFNEYFPCNIKSHKKLKIIKNDPISVMISSHKNQILAGIILYGRYNQKDREDELKECKFYVSKISIKDQNGIVVVEENGLGIYGKIINKILFRRNMILSVNIEYEMNIYVTDGFYYHGRPYGRNMDTSIKVGNSKHEGRCACDFNNAIGGVLLGFIIHII
ncbi:hypothetical protein SteCoe_24199 [Stentor coeruleus]|uniref:RING-type domain-containing protein n=1 Tax=Stentor coeruleus TaxID=5963 RepID=A0A1R2BIH6_9CILI|nr:hypothetical protein SteCoe_24199 [Stentor coeruleus]